MSFWDLRCTKRLIFKSVYLIWEWLITLSTLASAVNNYCNFSFTMHPVVDRMNNTLCILFVITNTIKFIHLTEYNMNIGNFWYSSFADKPTDLLVVCMSDHLGANRKELKNHQLFQNVSVGFPGDDSYSLLVIRQGTIEKWHIGMILLVVPLLVFLSCGFSDGPLLNF